MKCFLHRFALGLLFLLSSGCGAAPSQNHAPTIDASTIHTRVAATVYAAILTPTEMPSLVPVVMAAVEQTATPEATQTGSPTPTPAVISLPTMENVPLLEGYGSYGARVLAQPAAVVRDGITIQVEQVIVYPERIELVYTVRDIPHTSLFDPLTSSVETSCGGPDSYPNLKLPNGEMIIAESYLLDGKAFGTIQGPAAYGYLIHIYRAAVPEEVREMTMVLRCIGLARLDRTPLDWEVPFRVVAAGEKTK